MLPGGFEGFGVGRWIAHRHLLGQLDVREAKMFIGGSQRGHRRQSYSKDDKKTEGIEMEGLELPQAALAAESLLSRAIPQIAATSSRYESQ